MRVTDITPINERSNKPIRLAAYCRVSSSSEDQLHSFAAQIRYYNDYKRRHPEYELVDIYADEGLTGTCMDKRDELNRMLRDCQRGLIDRVITKSVSRLARNTIDILNIVRMLRSIGVSIYFEEQDLDSSAMNFEMFLTMPGMTAQNESMTLSQNLRWGIQKRMEKGAYKLSTPPFGFILINGQLEVYEPEAIIVRRIPSPGGKPQWHIGTIKSILTNVKYKGDAIFNRTYVQDVLSKKVVVNHGERPMIYIENSHAAIIDRATFDKVQTEMARRNGRRDTQRTDLKTKLGKHSSKYALTDILICGECGTAYRRVLWKNKDKYVPVWRCIGRLNKKRTCFHSPTMYEEDLHEAIMEAVKMAALQNTALLDQLKRHICIGLSEDDGNDRMLRIQVRLAEIETEFNELLSRVSSAESIENYDDSAIRRLMEEKHRLEDELAGYTNGSHDKESRLDDLLTVIEGIKNRPLPFDDALIYQMLDTVTVEAQDRIRVLFRGGLEMEQTVYQKEKRGSAD